MRIPNSTKEQTVKKGERRNKETIYVRGKEGTAGK